MDNTKFEGWDKFQIMILEKVISLNNSGKKLIFTSGSKAFDIDNAENGKSISIAKSEYDSKEIFNDELLDRLISQVL